MQTLAGKTVLVTGASKGIGAQIARQAGAAGAHVIAHYGSDQAGAEAAVADIAPSHKKLIGADFSDLTTVESLWDAAVDWQGRIDVLINNAALMLWKGGVDEDLDRWDEVWERSLQVNVLAPARLLRRAVRHYLEHDGGTLVTISSWSAQKGVSNPENIAYGSSKAAIHSATQSIARAYADQGILAYIIAPGVVRTRLSEQAAASMDGEDAVTASLAMGEWVPPGDIARTAVFLASGKVRHLSGATLDVNGASYIR